MAKGEGKGKDEEYEFKMPDFDEDAFIHKEMVSFRTTSILFVWGIIAALASWGIYEAMDGAKGAWWIGLAIMAVFAYLLRFIYPALKVDIRHFGRREWFGTFFLIFFAWLAFFILFINPPISDHADPTIEVFASPSVQLAGGDVTIDMFTADNFRVDHFTFELEQGGLPIATEATLIQDPDFPDHRNITLEGLAPGTYTYKATVEDRKGNTNATEGRFIVSGQAIGVDIRDGGDGSLDTGDQILVTVMEMEPCTELELMDGGDCIRTVYLDIQGGDRVVMEFDEDFNAWRATDVYTGWRIGENTFDVVVEQQDRFHGIERVTGGSLREGTFTVDVPNPQGTKDVAAPAPPADAPVSRRTPGFGLVAGVVVLVGTAVIARRRQE